MASECVSLKHVSTKKFSLLLTSSHAICPHTFLYLFTSIFLFSQVTVESSLITHWWAASKDAYIVIYFRYYSHFSYEVTFIYFNFHTAPKSCIASIFSILPKLFYSALLVRVCSLDNDKCQLNVYND